MAFTDLIIFTSCGRDTPELILLGSSKMMSGKGTREKFVRACTEGRSRRVLEHLYDPAYLNSTVIDDIISNECPEDSLRFMYEKNGEGFGAAGHDCTLKERYIKYISGYDWKEFIHRRICDGNIQLFNILLSSWVPLICQGTNCWGEYPAIKLIARSSICYKMREKIINKLKNDSVYYYEEFLKNKNNVLPEDSIVPFMKVIKIDPVITFKWGVKHGLKYLIDLAYKMALQEHLR